MQLSIQQLNQLSDLAFTAATLAGCYISQVDKSRLHTTFKDSGSSQSSQVVTEVDLQSQAIIIAHLQPSCEQFDIALLSEENCADTPINQHARLNKDYFWCIDPLDGTLPFIEGRTGYAVSIALVNQKGHAVISAVYLPATAMTYQSKIDDLGNTIVYKDFASMTPAECSLAKTLAVYCDDSFINSTQYLPLLSQLTDLLPSFGLQQLQVISGSGAVVNALSVLETPHSVYIKLPKKQQGGGALWDFSATACITKAMNGWVSDINGHPLNFNQTDSYYMNTKGIIFASNKKLAVGIIKRCRTLF